VHGLRQEAGVSRAKRLKRCRRANDARADLQDIALALPPSVPASPRPYSDLVGDDHERLTLRVKSGARHRKLIALLGGKSCRPRLAGR
jgi:hypothetical protein